VAFAPDGRRGHLDLGWWLVNLGAGGLALKALQHRGGVSAVAVVVVGVALDVQADRVGGELPDPLARRRPVPLPGGLLKLGDGAIRGSLHRLRVLHRRP
jgi:hypothetical protein